MVSQSGSVVAVNRRLLLIEWTPGWRERLWLLESEVACVTALELYLLTSATIRPLAISSSASTLFLIDDMEEVWLENILPLWTPSGLLIYSSRVAPFVINLQRVCHFLFPLWDFLLFMKLSEGLIWRHLRYIIHTNLVNSIVVLTIAIDLPEDYFSEVGVTLRITCLVLSQHAL